MNLNIQPIYNLVENLATKVELELSFPIDNNKTISSFKIGDFVQCNFTGSLYSVRGFFKDRVDLQNIESGYEVTISPPFLRLLKGNKELISLLYKKI